MLTVLPGSAHAATDVLTIEPPIGVVSVGDTVLVPVYLSTLRNVNAVDGEVSVIGPVTVVSNDTSGSVLTLWPLPPSLSGSAISFTGGAVTSLTGAHLKLFSIAVKITGAGPITFKVQHGTAYLADGQGTPLSLTGVAAGVTAGTGASARNDLAIEIQHDTTPPEPFTIDYGRDPQVYGGNYFISFGAVDTLGGIDHYDVTEGTLPSVRSGDTYVLQRQGQDETITVTAYNKAGRARVSTYTVSVSRPAGGVEWMWLLIIPLLLFAAVSYVLYCRSTRRRVKKRKR